MKRVSDFFERFKNLTPPTGALKKAIVHALTDVAHYTTTPDKISIQHDIAFIHTSSIIKQQIRIHRSQILDYIFREIPKARETLRDVR